MSTETKTRLATVEAPYRREIWLDDVQFDSGMRLLRVTVKEGRRFTQLDLDQPTAVRWAELMLDWANTAEGQAG